MASSSPQRETFYADILVTSVEQHGPMSVFGTVTDYQWWFRELKGGTAVPAKNGGGNAHYNWRDDKEGDGKLYNVNRRTAARAFTLLKSGPVVGLHETRRRLYLHKWRELEELDAEEASNIIQIGIFGEVRYS
jgi:hypothetical protein